MLTGIQANKESIVIYSVLLLQLVKHLGCTARTEGTGGSQTGVAITFPTHARSDQKSRLCSSYGWSPELGYAAKAIDLCQAGITLHELPGMHFQ